MTARRVRLTSIVAGFRRCARVSAAVLLASSSVLAQNRDAEIFGQTPPEPAPPPADAPRAPGATAPGAPGATTPGTSGPDAVPPGTAPTTAAPDAPPNAAPGSAVAPVDAAQTSADKPPPEAASARTATPAAPEGPASRDEQMLSGAESDMDADIGERLEEDPLAIGGLLYLRAQTAALEDQSPDEWAFNAPSLLDVYLDARPNPRVRGFVLGRMFYDPTLPESSTGSTAINPADPGGSSTGTQPLSSLFTAQTRGPRATLDQMWLRFDIARTVYVTAGKQHVRWGTARFWSPTDYLHLRNRNPLDVFDARTGTTLVKLHLPIESRAWNFYGYSVLEDEDNTATVDRIAGALRAEFVVDTAEIGLGVFARRDERAKFALDASFGVWDFDLYGELALRDRRDIDRVRFNPNATFPEPPMPQPWQRPEELADAQLRAVVDAFYPVYRREGYRPQAVGGISYSQKYNDNDVFSIGGEYFYNGLGYDSPKVYPGLVLPHSQELEEPATFFYLGRHYGALFATFPAPFSLDNHTFTLSTLGNLSDQSFVTRLDYSLVLLTHMNFEAFAAAHYGRTAGEFRFGVEDLTLGGFTFTRAPALLDLGIALRVAI